MHSFDVSAIKDCSISADGKLATLTLVTKYVGDMGITLPVECLKALPQQFSTAVPALQNSSAAETISPPITTSNQITLSVASNWLTAADKKREVVVVVINPNTPKHVGFAIKHEAARQLAAALVKQADAIVADKASPPASK
jgi:hypothetical protein